MDYIHSEIPQDDGHSEIAQTLADIEASLYAIEANAISGATDPVTDPNDGLISLLRHHDAATENNIPEGLAERTHNALRQLKSGVFSFDEIHNHIQLPYGRPQCPDARMLELLFRASMHASNNRSTMSTLADLISWIDIYQENTGREL